MTQSPVHLLVGTVFRNASAVISKAVDSVLVQVGEDFSVDLLLVDDASTDDWRAALGSRLRLPNVHVRSVAFRSAPAARNFVLDEAERAFPHVDYVCRLDADDVLAGSGVLTALAEKLRDRPDVVIAGNYQAHAGKMLPLPNRADRDLRDPARLLARVERMANGDASGELPSCNTVVQRGVRHRYPSVPSAEDHWYTAALLLDPSVRVVIAEDLIYSVYRLHGELTRKNAASERYFASRRALADHIREHIRAGTTYGAA